jgi:hypothetical protein
MDSTSESTVYYPTVEYTVNGKTYTAELDTASRSYRIGQAISVLYDPGNPSAVHDGSGFGLYLMIAGAVILAVVVFSATREKQSGGSTRIPRSGRLCPSVQGGKQKLCFRTELDTAGACQRIRESVCFGGDESHEKENRHVGAGSLLLVGHRGVCTGNRHRFLPGF